MSNLCFRFQPSALMLAAAVTIGSQLVDRHLATAQTIFLQDFTGLDTMEPEAPLIEIDPDQFVDLGVSADDPPMILGSITDGVVDFVDSSGSDRAYFLERQVLPSNAFTISFDLVAPVTDLAPATNEVLLRVGTGTGTNSLQSGEAIAEAIVYRGGPRGQFQNNGNETIFMILNNQDTEVMFESPIDQTQQTLAPFQYVTYTRDNNTNTFPGEVKGITDFNTANGTALVRFSIGSSGNGSQGTFSLDNVLVETGATFERPIFGATPGDVDGDMDVDMDDYEAIRDHMFLSVTMRSEGDLTRDGIVDFTDFRQWKNNFPMSAPDPGGAAVPEPASLILALVACAVAAAITRRP